MLALARHSHAVICTNREDMLAINNGQVTINNEQNPNLQSPILHPSPLPLLTAIPLGPNIEPQPPAGFERSAWRAKLGLKPGTFLLAYFGFLNESKGGEELIEALALLRQGGLDAHLLLIGGDVGQADPTNVAYAQKVQALIEQYGLKEVVHRTGYVEQPEVSASLFAADALVMPYRDGASFRRTTLLAALRHGCPIITTTPADLRLMPEIKPGENMLLVPPREATALAQVICTLAGDRALQQKLAQGAWQLSELFNWEQIAGQTLRVYQTLLRLG
jgi:glycosyltransferase involved in cell wall biosynthesis